MRHIHGDDRLHDGRADHTTFDEFYRAHEPMIRRALIAVFGVVEGHEASAAAMAYGFEHWSRVADMENPAGYLYKVGRGSRRVRRKPLPLAPPAVAEPTGYEPGLPKAMNRLSEPQRQAVLLVTAWGYPLAEAADVLGVSISTLRNHLDRGLTKLRRTIGSDDA